jgi:release factor glutamine methyltransferase
MRRIIKGILHRTWKPYVQWYLKSPRTYRWGDIRIMVQPEVFHPGFFFSTALLLKYLGRVPLNEKKVIEVGSGSGLISLFCAKQGADVCACDINPAAVENTKANAASNRRNFPVYLSNLFNEVPQTTFDYILVNPPYYKKKPVSIEDHAWYCGENLEYFDALFRQAATYSSTTSEMLMVLSDECDIDGIRSVSERYGWQCVPRVEKQVRWEKNYILSFIAPKEKMEAT